MGSPSRAPWRPKISIASGAGLASAPAMATPMKAAVHGDATMTASKPVKKLPRWPPGDCERLTRSRQAPSHGKHARQVQAPGEEDPSDHPLTNCGDWS